MIERHADERLYGGGINSRYEDAEETLGKVVYRPLGRDPMITPVDIVDFLVSRNTDGKSDQRLHGSGVRQEPSENVGDGQYGDSVAKLLMPQLTESFCADSWIRALAEVEVMTSVRIPFFRP